MLPSDQPADQESESSEATLFEHTSKKEWGLAVLAWEREDKRGFQFEDGKLRVFKEGYFDLMQQVDRPADEAARALDQLQMKLGRRRAAKRLADRPAVSLNAQIEYFRSQYPEGFRGKKWLKERRGEGAKKRLKRHRDAAVQEATELCTPETVRAAAEGEPLVFVCRLADLGEATNLVSKTHVGGMTKMNDAQAAQVLNALHEVLWGEGETAERFDRYLGTLRRGVSGKVTWQLATVVPALVVPTVYPCIKPSSAKRQAAWMAPDLTLGGNPSGRAYARLCSMFDRLEDELGRAELQPADRLDIYDFIEITLRPKAIKEILASD